MFAKTGLEPLCLDPLNVFYMSVTSDKNSIFVMLNIWGYIYIKLSAVR